LEKGLPMAATLDAIRHFYAPYTGRRPELQGPIEFPPD